ncbi:MAG TPA: M23 family metallopeptidase [Gemmatimonadales bacterium]
MPSYVNCSVYPDSRSAAYVLPWAVGRQFRTSRTWGHYLTPDGNIQAGGVQLYAIDVPMPIGTPVHAMRGGVVAAVEERFSDDDHGRLHENWVMVRHSDGTVARYIHLTLGGAMVEVGEAVQQGQVVGLSGNSGESSAPHLHFDVQVCGPNLPPGLNNLPCGQTVPLSFRNTTVQSCGLRANTQYTALPFTADVR